MKRTLRDRRSEIFSPGQDKTRDWRTLLEAFGNDDRFDVIIMNRNIHRKTAKAYTNVREPPSYDVVGLKTCYRWADVVVVPMVENLYSGITVALEATALGAPVICSDTGGVPTYFDPGEVLYVPPGDPAALRDAVLTMSRAARRAMVARAQQRFVDEDYTTAGLASRYADLSREILGDASVETTIGSPRRPSSPRTARQAG